MSKKEEAPICELCNKPMIKSLVCRDRWMCYNCNVGTTKNE